MANPEHLEILKQGVEVWNRWRKDNPDVKPELTEADLSGAVLSKANLSGANLIGTNLIKAKLTGADLSKAILNKAHLIKANLREAVFIHSNLNGTILERTIMSETTIGGVDLSNTIGLQSAKHYGPSTVGIDTIYASGGKIPEAFLRGCGVPDNFIQYMSSLIGKAFEYYSCFISYSSKDQDFAERLYADLQNK